MDINLLNLMLAFIEGLGLILSPCILPILPIVLSGSIEGGRKRPLGIILGFILVFALFTLFSHFLVSVLGINLDVLRNVAFVLIALFGIVMMSSFLTEKFAILTQKLADIGNQLMVTHENSQGFFSGFFLGSLIGLIWSPCVGPILAAALIQIAIQKTFSESFSLLVFFALGSVLPMIAIAFLGKKLLTMMQFFKKYVDVLRKLLGIVITLSAVSLAYISYVNPNLLVFTPHIQVKKNEQTLAQLNIHSTIVSALSHPYLAPSLGNHLVWINLPPLNLAALKGKVILIDFWTYSCINCIRTLPYLIAWDKAYRNKGLVIIGVHTPEFEFEKNENNVREAVKRFNINYPVVLDNEYQIWQNFHNQYWPAHYLIDKTGKVVYQHFGEGEYSITEHNICTLLNACSGSTRSINQKTEQYDQTPETYFGYARSEHFANEQINGHDKVLDYHFPRQLSLDAWALKGSWLIYSDYIAPKSVNAAMKLHFSGRHVYLVAGSQSEKPVNVRVLFNNKELIDNAGKDIQKSLLTIKDQRLYDVLNFKQPTEGELTLLIDSPGVSLYTFTFG